MDTIPQKTEKPFCFVINCHLGRFYPGGWGNGYVAIPPGHELHGMSYDMIHNNYTINVHGGLTYADYPVGSRLEGIPEDWWVIGFDTCHYGDNLTKWPESAVRAEAQRLLYQVNNLTQITIDISFEEETPKMLPQTTEEQQDT
jgi:hypothetical protein